MKSLIFFIFIIVLGLYFYSTDFIITLLLISFLVFFHELGHFLAAKSLGVGVEVFSIGFGKKLIAYDINKTNYRISALPLGGYVRLKGQDDLNPSKENLDKDSYSVLSPIKKIYILFAGPFFNIMLAFLLYVIIGHMGELKLAASIGDIAPNSPAFKANLQSKDKILEINGTKIKSFDEIAPLLKLENTSLKIQRNNEIKNIIIKPELNKGYNDFMQEIQKPMIGISPSGDTIMIYNKGLDSLSYALDKSLQSSTLIIKGLVKLIIGDIDPKNIGGIITMVDVTSKASDMGINILLLITALISINLGILNLLPIPMLDGGHIVFNLYEGIFRKKISKKIIEYLSYGGMAILLAIMIFATINDIIRFIK